MRGIHVWSDKVERRVEGILCIAKRPLQLCWLATNGTQESRAQEPENYFSGHENKQGFFTF